MLELAAGWGCTCWEEELKMLLFLVLKDGVFLFDIMWMVQAPKRKCFTAF
jgi:hypothetical protein